jgi:hypothetical protein
VVQLLVDYLKERDNISITVVIQRNIIVKFQKLKMLII